MERESAHIAIPSYLTDALDNMERSMSELDWQVPPQAVFDLDDTLVIGDVGEAVFIQLLAEGEQLDLTWSEYQLLREKSKPQAYRAIVQAMKGLPVSAIERAAYRVASHDAEVIEVQRSQVRVPRPHPIMEPFVRHLSHRGYDVSVISASSQIAVRIICPLWFRVPECRCFGIASVVERGKVQRDLREPVPIGDGKRAVYEEFISKEAPWIAGGNSSVDLAMLNMVRQKGLVVWVGEDRISYEVMKARLSGTRQFRYISRPQPDSLAAARVQQTRQGSIISAEKRSVHPT